MSNKQNDIYYESKKEHFDEKKPHGHRTIKIYEEMNKTHPDIWWWTTTGEKTGRWKIIKLIFRRIISKH